MNVVGRRSSSGSGWSWSRPPSTPSRPPPGPPLLPLAGAALLFLIIGLALLAIRLSDSDDNSPTGVADTPTPVPSTVVVSSPIPSATPVETPTPTQTATPTPTLASSAPLFSLAVFDEGEWQFDALSQAAAYHEGEAIPLLLRIDNTLPGAAYQLTIRYTCEGINLLRAYGLDTSSEPALASGGPGSATADSTVQIPDDPGTDDDDGGAGSLSLWGGSFVAIGALLPPSPCTDQKSLSVSFVASADTLFIMWSAQLSEEASDSDLLLRLVVQLPDGDELSFEIEPASIAPVQP